MYFQEIGAPLKEARKSRGLTQQALAELAGLSRTTVNQLENGVFPDLGAKKLLTLLSAVGLELALAPKPKHSDHKDYLKLACTSANVSFKEFLTPDELVGALLSGMVPKARRPQLRAVFDEVPASVFDGMLAQVGAWATPERVQQNVGKLAGQIGSRRRAHKA